MSITVALVIIFVVNSGNAWKAEKQLAAMMMKCEASKIGVYRGAKEPTMVSNDDLVVGDVFKFANGLKIPADAVMISGKDVKCDENALTGEPDAFEKVALDEELAQND